MSLTVWGCASTIGGLAVERDQLDRVIGGHSYDDIALELPEGGIDVDLDHQAPVVGQLVYGEVTDSGRLNVVCVVDDDQIDLSRIDEPVYFSIEAAMVGDRIRARSRSYIADRAHLYGIALTMDPLTAGATPIKHRSGDLRRNPDRSSWPLSWRSTDPLLARAADHVGTDLRTRARRLVDLRERYDDNPWRLREGDPVPVAEQRPAGELRYRPGTILRVS